MAKPGPKGPSKQEDERLKIIFDELERSGNEINACRYASITHQTMKNWKAKDELFALKVEYHKAIAISRLAKAAEEKDPWKPLKNIASEYRDEIRENILIGYAEDVRDDSGDSTPI